MTGVASLAAGVEFRGGEVTVVAVNMANRLDNASAVVRAM